MSEHKTISILWGPNTRTYMFGTRIRYQSDGVIQLYNPMIPSGTELHSWSALQNYQGSRSQPALPLLKKGVSYRLRAHLTSQPANSVFLKIRFLDRYEREVSQIIEKSQTLVFTYPEDAYTYQVSLLSAGVTEMTFEALSLQEKEKDDADIE